MKIGVFDSGVGGQSVINAIKKEMPKLEIVYKDDKKHLPYGTKKVEQIHKFVRPIFQEFIDEGCKAIVIACNTVTTNLAEKTKSYTIAVCATPRTLSSDRYQWLKSQYAKGVYVLEPDCSEWAMMIENNTLDRKKIAKTTNKIIGEGADVIVLGCTHYHWIEDEMRQIVDGRAQIIQPEEPVIKQLERVLNSLDKKPQ